MDYFDMGFMSLRIHPTQVRQVGLRISIKTPQLLGVYGTRYGHRFLGRIHTVRAVPAVSRFPRSTPIKVSRLRVFAEIEMSTHRGKLKRRYTEMSPTTVRSTKSLLDNLSK